MGYVTVSNGPDLVSGQVRTAREAFVYAALGALLLAVAVGLVVSRGLTSPLRELTGVAGRMSGGDLSTRAPIRRKDEIGQLSAEFNRMAERLEASFGELASERDALRRFIADASHELRTPITALRSFNELMQGPASDDAPARAEFLAESGKQLDRLEWVTANLLDLSRLDAGLVELDLAPCDAGQLVVSVAQAFKALAGERGVALAIQATDGLEVVCDRARMEVVLSNLLDNAIKHSLAGDSVSLGVEAGEQEVEFWVRDSGPGIEPEDLPRIFDRFYRGRSSPPDGNGLGLAIVHSIVQAHGGTVLVESEPGQGALFVVKLPAGLRPSEEE
jgi:signal transduction histidine kinase